MLRCKGLRCLGAITCFYFEFALASCDVFFSLLITLVWFYQTQSKCDYYHVMIAN